MSAGVLNRVLVTGAAGALGTDVVKRFLAGGYQVIATDQRVPRGERPTGLEWVQMDLADPQSIQANAAGFRNVDAFVHCAGGFRFANADQLTDDDLDFLIAANLVSAMRLTREVLPGMKARNYGSLVFVSSRATLHPTAGMGAYLAAKAGLNAFVLSVADEVRAFDVNVNAVLATVMDTPANRRDMPGADPATWVATADMAETLFGLTQSSSRLIRGALIAVPGRL